MHLIVEIVFWLMRLPGNGCLQVGLISESQNQLKNKPGVSTLANCQGFTLETIYLTENRV